MIPEGKEAEYERLLELLREAGADDPEGWAGSEVHENIAQLARYCFLRSLWPRHIDTWRDDLTWVDRMTKAAEKESQGFFGDAGQAMANLTKGGTREDLGRIARFVAYCTIFDLLYHLDFGTDPDLEDRGISDKYPGWALMEIGPNEELTGRDLGGLYESLLTMDPSGREGRPAPEDI
jgi:hypothetical protein